MKIRYEFEINPRQTLDLEPRDFADCDNLEALEMDLLEQPEPGWRVSVNKNDLEAFWQLVQELRALAGER